MQVSEGQICRFGDLEIDVTRGRLTRGGEECRLRQRSFEVLAYLIDRRDRVVSKQELFDSVWRQTAVTDDALVQCIKEIRRALGDDFQNPRYIRTIPKVGYRFIASPDAAPLRTYASEAITKVELEYEWHTTDEPAAATRPALPSPRMRSWPAIAVVSLIIAGTALGMFLGVRSFAPADDDHVVLARDNGRKGVVVMFFDNASASADVDWLSQGLADMLITDLSRSEKLTVLSRDQLDRLLGRRPDGSSGAAGRARDVAARVGADLVITGSFAKLGNAVRIDAQVTNAADGTPIASESLTVERTERILTDIDLLSLRLMTRLGVWNSETESKLGLASAMTDDLEAYRCYSLALEKADGLHKAEAIELLQKAVELDPDFAMAHARIGYVWAVTWGWPEKAKPHLERAFQMSDRLTEKDRLYIAAWYALANSDFPGAIDPLRQIIQRYPTETEAYLRLGYILRGEEKFDKAIEVMQQGLSSDPESAPMYNSLGLLYSLLGRHEEAVAMHERYVALDPNEPNAHDSLGMTYQWAGRYEEAIDQYRKSLELNPKFEVAQVHLGVSYYQIGRYKDAIDAFRKYADMAPGPLDRARAAGHTAHAYRALGDLRSARPFIERVVKEKLYIWEAIEYYDAAGDAARRTALEPMHMADHAFNSRGSRNTLRHEHYQRGYNALRQGNVEEAVASMQEALRHPPATWEIDPIEDCLASTYLKIGRYDDAIAEYQRVLNLNPRYPLAHFHIAEAYERKGDTAEAANFYRQFLTVWAGADDNIPEIIAARDRLNAG